MGWLATWWVWIGLAMCLGIAEILLPSFFFLGFALSAVVIAVVQIALPDLMAGMTFNEMMALFAALALVCWLIVKFLFRNQSSGAQTFTDDVND